jgi:magnesium chelatase subunit D
MMGRGLAFSAIVGQDRMKLALVLNAINPAIGGVLIRGERGTAKSTAVRALATLLPEQTVVEGCRFACDPNDPGALCWECRARMARGEHLLPTTNRRMKVVELPINASEDRVVGTIDLEAALREGVKRFEPGLLAQANRNILYVDEVNLLDDHIVDVLLDAAATGVNVVEREGLSLAHPSKFFLVGTMNPAEGELRPQLLDRFGLCVDVQATRDVGERMEIAERDAAHCVLGCSMAYDSADQALRERLRTGIDLLRSVDLTDADARLIATECAGAGVEGHRADVVSARTARAIAAYRGRKSATLKDLYDAMEMALSHRARQALKRPVEGNDDEAAAEDQERSNQSPPSQQTEAGENPPRQRNDHTGDDSTPPEAKGDSPEGRSDDGSPRQSDHRKDDGSDVRGGRDPEAEHMFTTRRLELEGLQKPRQKSGRRALSLSTDKRGRYVYAEPRHRITDLALDATLRAAAPHQVTRGRKEGSRLLLERRDLRQKVRKRKVGNLVVFAVDASGSMDADKRMAVTKGAALSLLQDAYVRRDKVAVIVFRNRSAEVVVPPTGGAALAKKRLAHVNVGGTTPLTQGLISACALIRTATLRDSSLRPLLIVISDGHANVPAGTGDPVSESRDIASQIRSDGIEALLVDSTIDSTDPALSSRESEVFMYHNYSRSLCRRLAEAMGARHCGLYDLARDLPALVRQRTMQGRNSDVTLG